MVYPIKTKEAVIKKVLIGGKLHHEIASEAGIGLSTLTYWLKNHKKYGNENLIEKENNVLAWLVSVSFKLELSWGKMWQQFYQGEFF